MNFTFNPFTGNFDYNTDFQTLSFNEITQNLSILNGNTVSLSALSITNVLSSTNTLSSTILLARIFNGENITLSKGDVVYTFGSTGNTMSVKLASNTSEATSSKTLGFVNETIPKGKIGYAVIAGEIDKMNFPHQTFAEGDALWLGSIPGSFTNVKPAAPNHGVYLGVIERADQGNGLAYVKVQNGYELDEIHDVLITSISANQILKRNSSNTLWINSDTNEWDSVYTTVQGNSGNWQTAYAYVSANSVNLTATNIFVTNNLTVTETVSAKYYQGTLLDWMTLVRGTKTTPTLLATIGTGDVYAYVYSTATTDKTYYRYIATNGSEDSFYGNFNNPTLSNLIATKKIIL